MERKGLTSFAHSRGGEVQSDHVTGLVRRLDDGSGREGLDRESGVGRRAGGDESSGDRVDIRESEGGVLRSVPGSALEPDGRNPGLVSRLNGQDGSGSGDVVLVGDEARGSEVGRDTNVLNHGGKLLRKKRELSTRMVDGVGVRFKLTARKSMGPAFSSPNS